MPGLLLSEKRRHWKKARPSEGKGQMSQGWSEPAVFKDGLCSGWNGGAGGATARLRVEGEHDPMRALEG